jgi:acetyl esterase/lipase
MLALEKEGLEVAHWLNTLGVTAFVLRYRVGPVYRHPVEMRDGQRAVRWVRAHAALFHIDPGRVGMLGFSAGGHLTATVATHFDAGEPKAADSVDRFSCRPDFQILVYPVISMESTFTHRASRTNLLGREPGPALMHFLSAESQVTARTPPAFIVHAKTDPIVPFANGQAYYRACLKAGVPAEFRIFEQGTHAFGMASDPVDAQVSAWPADCARWMKAQGWIE